jgi:hypothetical protein
MRAEQAQMAQLIRSQQETIAVLSHSPPHPTGGEFGNGNAHAHGAPADSLGSPHAARKAKGEPRKLPSPFKKRKPGRR